MIEPGDEVILCDPRTGHTGIALWRVSQVDYAQGVMELELKPGEWHEMALYRVALTRYEVAQWRLTHL